MKKMLRQLWNLFVLAVCIFIIILILRFIIEKFSLIDNPNTLKNSGKNSGNSKKSISKGLNKLKDSNKIIELDEERYDGNDVIKDIVDFDHEIDASIEQSSSEILIDLSKKENIERQALSDANLAKRLSKYNSGLRRLKE